MTLPALRLAIVTGQDDLGQVTGIGDISDIGCIVVLFIGDLEPGREGRR